MCMAPNPQSACHSEAKPKNLSLPNHVYGTQSSASGISVSLFFEEEALSVDRLEVEIGEGVSLGRGRSRASSSVCL